MAELAVQYIWAVAITIVVCIFIRWFRSFAERFF